jgi:hypothetical protein
MVRAAGAFTLFAAVAGCGMLPGRSAGPGAAPVQAPPAQRATPDGRRLSAPRGSGLSLVGQCKQRELDGFAEDATVQVANGEVRALSWMITVGKRGTCRFEAGQFRQTRTSPTVELTARDGSGCKLMMWGDPRRITLAHAGCARFCTPGIYDQAWPVMFDPATGRCADIER